MLRDSVVVVVVVRTRPRAIPLAMITMRKSTHGFPFVSLIWIAYGAPLGGPSGRRSSAIIWFTFKLGLDLTGFFQFTFTPKGRQAEPHTRIGK